MIKYSTAQESLARLNRRISNLADPRQKRWLSVYRDHWWAEVVGDVEAVMATMSRGPIRYTFDGHPFMVAEGISAIETYDDTRRMYQGVVDLGVNMAGPVDDERVLFDDIGLTIICTLNTIYPGVFLGRHSAPIDPEKFYFMRWPNVTIIRFDDADLMMGEEIFNGAPLVVEEVPRSMIPELIDGPVVAA